MNVKVGTNFFCLVLLVGILSLARQAQATLGEGADSIIRDRKALSATQRSTTCRASYHIQEIASQATTIREYLTLSGVVFAIAWNGLVNPDLTTLLGSYAGEFEEAKRQSPPRPGQRQLTVRTNRVVVETGGHMRDLRGRAYLPALLPVGMSFDEIN